MKRLLPVLCSFSVVGLSLLTIAALLPFSLNGMEKERQSATFNSVLEAYLYKRESKHITNSEPIDNLIKQITNLLEKGINPNEKFGFYTPLAILAQCLESIKSLDNPTFWELDLKSFEFVVESLLDHGADINKTQKIYDYTKKNTVEKSNYDLLKPFMPNLDDIIKKVEDKKRKAESDKRHADDFAKAVAEQRRHFNQSIKIKGQEFKLHEAIASIRCPKFLVLNLV